MNSITLTLLCFPMVLANINRIPDDFIMGVATSAYQIEGAWNEDGRSPSIWDRFVHKNQNDTGDIACDSYHRYLEDIEMLKYLNVTHYRFSVSWSRILPDGTISKINPLGIQYYHNLIDALLDNDIQPMVTLYHFDLPQALQDLGGWLNPQIVEYFANYSRIMFNEYGDKVKYWFTINEPRLICVFGYGIGTCAPGIKNSGTDDYICNYNVLKAHARAYHIYDDEFRKTQNGRITLTIDMQWMEPASDSQLDREAAERRMQFDDGMYANPIFHPNGNFPQIVIDRIDARSRAEGYNISRLPKFTQTDIDYIKGTADYFALNTYFTQKIKWIEDLPIDNSPSRDKDESVGTIEDNQWGSQISGWSIYPIGMRKLLNWIDQHYNHPEIIITENGYCDEDGRLDDDARINYYNDYIRNTLLARYEDGVNVTGYLTWSLMDNFEWYNGYSLKFGLYHVDFNDLQRRRTIKKSGEYFKQLIRTRRLNSSGLSINGGFLFICSIIVSIYVIC